MSDPVLEIIDVSRDYRGLRPLRIERLDVAAGEHVAILGLDQMTAEVFVNLVTGATVPDRGDVRIFGRPTAAIADSDEWLALVDRFGIVSERAVLLDALTVIQNLSMPFSLEIEPPGADVRARAEALAQEADLPAAAWDRPLGELEGAARMRVRMARALALDPAILLLEHPTAGVPRDDAAAMGRHMRAVARRRGAAIVAATADEEFAGAVATRVLRLDPATGRLTSFRSLRTRLWGRR